MATRKTGLGRGLEALLGGRGGEPSTLQQATPAEMAGDGLRRIAVGQLGPGKYQPRTAIDVERLTELAESIKAQGVIQPIVAREISRDKFEIIAGERRWRAAMQAGLDDVPVVLRDVDDRAVIAMALIENIQREDLNPLEEAQGIARLVNEFHLTHEQAAQAVGRSRSAASNLLRLLHLAEPVQQMLMAGDLDMGHARALLPSKVRNKYWSPRKWSARNSVCARRRSWWRRRPHHGKNPCCASRKKNHAILRASRKNSPMP